MLFKPDPGPCIVCGAEHTACTHDSGPIVVSQLPSRDAARRLSAQASAPASIPTASGEVCAPGTDATTFSTATYRRDLHGPRPRRGRV